MYVTEYYKTKICGHNGQNVCTTHRNHGRIFFWRKETQTGVPRLKLLIGLLLVTSDIYLLADVKCFVVRGAGLWLCPIFISMVHTV
ncbi:hypothetical protein FWK35_00001074 [Aphis craccivora]|uniref:Uncharacterized protein n=1 Tax=Aphis craccivora TaxID=307492 RepID=A0A6G0ZQ31_APHCR|nr:hypothetical protein FWK35_00001074 [Aphis craccivora]